MAASSGFLKWGYPNQDGVELEILLKLTIWGYPYDLGNPQMFFFFLSGVHGFRDTHQIMAG